MAKLKFTKMHGLGNDFMVVDAVRQPFFRPEAAPIARWADRHTGIGFDQLLVVEPARSAEADFRYRIFNADGGEVEQCGNGARCFARFVAEQGLTGKREIAVETMRGIIRPKLEENGLVTVDMGAPRFAPEDVPFILLAGETPQQTQYTLTHGGRQAQASMVGMGNPHAVMRVDDVQTAPVAEWGAALQQHPRFPERVNAGFMQVLDEHHIRLRVYERGTGETQACGTGACAAAVAGVRLGLLASGKPVRVSLPGGDLSVCWQEGGTVMMTGPAVRVFDGEINYADGAA